MAEPAPSITVRLRMGERRVTSCGALPPPRACSPALPLPVLLFVVDGAGNWWDPGDAFLFQMAHRATF